MVDDCYNSDFIFIHLGQYKVSPPFKLKHKMDNLRVPDDDQFKTLTLLKNCSLKRLPSLRLCKHHQARVNTCATYI